MPERRLKTYFNHMKKLFFCAAALLAAISFAACSDDDDETNLPVTSDNIVGTWQIVHEEGWEIYDGEKDTWSWDYPDEDGWYCTLTFDKKSSLTNIEYEGGNEIDRKTVTYSISGNTLTLKDEYSNEESVEIKKLTESELVLFDSEEDWFEESSTYKRIK